MLRTKGACPLFLYGQEQQAIGERGNRLVTESQLARPRSAATGLLVAIEAVETFRRRGLQIPAAAVRNLVEAVAYFAAAAAAETQVSDAGSATSARERLKASDLPLGELLDYARRLAGRRLTAEERREFGISDP